MTPILNGLIAVMQPVAMYSTVYMLYESSKVLRLSMTSPDRLLRRAMGLGLQPASCAGRARSSTARYCPEC